MSGPRQALERRYRRLLACYPRAHRTEYGEEMLAVLLADDTGRWPGPAAVGDLLVGAGWAWLGRGRVRAATGRWSGVAAVLGLVLPFSLVLGSLPWFWIIFRYGSTAGHWQNYVLPEPLMLTWAVVLALAFTRLRRATAVAAWVCAVPQALYAVYAIATSTRHSAYQFGLPGCWPLVMLVAAAALTAVALRGRDGDPRGAATLAVRRLGPVATVLLLSTAGLLALCIVRVGPVSLGTLYVLSGQVVGWGAAWPLTGALVAALALAALVALGRRAGLPAALRVAALALALGVLFAGSGRILVLVHALRLTSDVVYVLVRWLAVPLLAFVVVALAARLAERRRRPTTRGRAVDRG